MPGENIQDWSTTAASNGASDSSINWAEGQSRASVNNSARSMMAAHAKDRNLQNGSIVTGGTANAQTFFSGLTYTTIPTGLMVKLKIGFSNTGSTTLNMDGISDVTIKDQYAQNLVGGELILNAYADLLYNGTNWILLDLGYTASNPASNVPGTVNPLLASFEARSPSVQAISPGVWTKVNLSTETYDSGSFFDNVTNYRFTPLVAGQYLFTAFAAMVCEASNAMGLSIYKNGAAGNTHTATSAQSGATLAVSQLVFLNGTTDYIELFALGSGTAITNGVSGVLQGTRLMT